MAFRFSLAPLLRLRQSVERQQAQRLQLAALAVAQAREALAQMDRALADSARADEISLRGGRRAAELQFAAEARLALRARRREQETEVARLELARHAAAADYHSAYRKREVLDSLSAQQRRTYRQQQQQRAQRDLDASHLLQLWRKHSD